jgi:hypothetical protein
LWPNSPDLNCAINVSRRPAVGYHMIAQSHLNMTETQYESLFAAIRCTLQIRMILKKMFIECNNGYNSFVFMRKSII